MTIEDFKYLLIFGLKGACSMMYITSLYSIQLFTTFVQLTTHEKFQGY